MDERAMNEAEDASNDGMVSLAQAELAFNQERAMVAKLAREQLEDRYLRLLEENVGLKKASIKQQDKMKKLATKLVRLLSEKKRMESGPAGSKPISVTSGPNLPLHTSGRDLEVEELIEDQQFRIRELEHMNNQLKDKLMVAKQQLLSSPSAPGALRGIQAKRNLPRGVAHPMMIHPQGPVSPVGSVPVMGATSAATILTQEAHSLLEEARNENRKLEDTVATLREQVNIFEQEVEQIREQNRIRESNLEEEITSLKEDLHLRERQNVAENLELIRLQQDKKAKATQIMALQAQVLGLEEQLTKLKSEVEVLRKDLLETSSSLQEEQKRNVTLGQQISSSSLQHQALMEAEAKMTDLLKENAILRESNNRLLDSAYDLERERHFHAAENALKVEVARLESTLKSDLNDKKSLIEALAKEREEHAKLEAEFKDLQSKFFDLKESCEKQSLHQHPLDPGDPNANIHTLIQNQDLPTGLTGLDQFLEAPSFLDVVPMEQSELKSELAELQSQHLQTLAELEKSRNLLRVQANISQDQKLEVEALQRRLQQIKLEHQVQIAEYKKMIDLRAARIQKLEQQIRQQNYDKIKVFSEGHDSKAVVLHGRSGHSVFEMNVSKVSLVQEAVWALTKPDGPDIRLFCTWTFFDHDLQYTPAVSGPAALFDCTALYKVKLDDSMLDYMDEQCLHVELHMLTDPDDCAMIGQAEIKLKELLLYPNHKLHGSVILYGESAASKAASKRQNVIGTLDYWIKWHLISAKPIQDWLDHRQKMKAALLEAEQRQKMKSREEIERDMSGQMSPNDRPDVAKKADDQIQVELLQPPQTMPRTSRINSASSDRVRVEKEVAAPAPVARPRKVIPVQGQSREVSHPGSPSSVKSETQKVTDPLPVDPGPSSPSTSSLSSADESSLDPSPAKAAAPHQNSPHFYPEVQVEVKNEHSPKTTAKDEPLQSQAESHSVGDNVETEEEGEDEKEEEEEEVEAVEEEDDDEEEDEDEEEDDEDSEEYSSEEAASSSDVEGKANMETVTEDTGPERSAATGFSSSEVSHDSEGVVIRKVSPESRKASFLKSNDDIVITVTSFRAAKGAKFLKNKKIHSLYVEYQFLDLPLKDTETPFALPKPQNSNESIVFNFRKVIPVDKSSHSGRRKALIQMLTEGLDTPQSKLTFTVVSEPPEPELDCQEIGTATADLASILRTGCDIIDQELDVFSSECRTKVGRLLHGNRPIGHLVISVQAVGLFKSLFE